VPRSPSARQAYATQTISSSCGHSRVSSPSADRESTPGAAGGARRTSPTHRHPGRRRSWQTPGRSISIACSWSLVSTLSALSRVCLRAGCPLRSAGPSDTPLLGTGSKKTPLFHLIRHAAMTGRRRPSLLPGSLYKSSGLAEADVCSPACHSIASFDLSDTLLSSRTVASAASGCSSPSHSIAAASPLLSYLWLPPPACPRDLRTAAVRTASGRNAGVLAR
jgi:hypothetical protein